MSDPTHQDQDDTDLAKLHTEFFDLMSEFINLNLKSNGKLVEYLTGQLATRSENGKQAMASPVIHTPIKASKLNDKKSSTNLNPNDNKDKDDHSEGSTISGKIIELTSKYPEMFYHMQGPSKSLWQSLFEKFKSNLRDNRVESAILWICRLQTYSSKYGLLQPRFLQVWFCYFFDYYNLSEFDVNPSLDLLIATLNDTKVLCQQGLVKSSALAMITISQYSSLLNFVILNKMAEGHANEKMIRAYKMVKQLLFECRRPCIVTNRPAKVFRTLFPQIDKLEPRVQVEIMDSMYSLLCFKPPIQSEEFYNSWTNDIEKYVDQSNVFLEFMLKNPNAKSSRWKRAHKASLRLHLTGMVKRLQSMPRTPKGEELIWKLRALSKKTLGVDPRIKVFLWFGILLVLGFLTYALVYVQCDVDSSRVCPLPFEPHQIIERSTSNLNDILQHYQPIITKKATILNDKLQLHYSSILKSSTSILNQIYTQLDFLNDPRLQLAFANYFMLKDKLDQACEPLLASMSNHVDQLISRTVTFTKVQYLLLPTYRKILLSKVHGLAVLLVDNLIPRFKLELANSYHSAIAIINKSAISSRHALMKTWELVHFLIFMDSKKFAETVDKYPIVGKSTKFYSAFIYPAYEKYLVPTGKIIVKHAVAIHAEIMPIIRRSTVYSYIQPLFDLISYLKVEYYSPSIRAFMDYYERRGKSQLKTVTNVSKSAFKKFLHVVDQLWMVLEGRAELSEKIHELLAHSKKVVASETCQNIHHYCIKLTGQQKLDPKQVVNAPVQVTVNDRPPIDMGETDKTQVNDGSLTSLTKSLETVETVSQIESTLLPIVDGNPSQAEVFINERNRMDETTFNTKQSQDSQTAEIVISNFDDFARNDVIAGPDQDKDLKNLKIIAPQHEPKTIADETQYILDAQEIANPVIESEPPSNEVDFDTGAVDNNGEQVHNEL